jgi:hypothetical protein
MGKVAKKIVEENQDTWKSCLLWKNVGKIQ